MASARLVDAILRQTSVLIAQLTSSSGIRTPLSRVLDQVFLGLARALEEQGLSRKVVADMFGLTLRSYQRRVQRAVESAPEPSRTLWQAVFEHLQQSGPTARTALLDRFPREDPEAVGAVLSDLVRSGLASRTGSGSGTVYAPTAPDTWRALARQGRDDTLAALLWLDVCRHPGITTAQLAELRGQEEPLVDALARRLSAEGRLTRAANGSLRAAEAMVVPVGAEEGLEAAVLDHYQAVVSALTGKLRASAAGQASTTVGGTTLCFELHPAHPLRHEVLDLLARFRQQTDELWERVEAENELQPTPPSELEKVVFYFGQYVDTGGRTT